MSKEKYADETQEKHSVDPSYYDGPQKNPFSMSRFLYNGKEGTVLGRSAESWGKIESWIFQSERNSIKFPIQKTIV